MLSSELSFASSLVHRTFILTLLRHLYVKLERAVKLAIFQLALMEWCLCKKDKQANTIVCKRQRRIPCFGARRSHWRTIKIMIFSRLFPTLAQATTVALPSMACHRATVSSQTRISSTIPRVCKLSPHWVYLLISHVAHMTKTSLLGIPFIHNPACCHYVGRVTQESQGEVLLTFPGDSPVYTFI